MENLTLHDESNKAILMKRSIIWWVEEETNDVMNRGEDQWCDKQKRRETMRII